MHHVRRLTVLAALAGALAAAAPATAAVRQYWVAAVPDHAWNIVPNGQDALTGMQFDPAKTTLDTVVYRRFSTHWKAPLPSEYGGVPGPTIHARVGDVILVHFLNLDLNAPHSMHFHGVHYAFPSDGSYIPGFSGRGADVLYLSPDGRLGLRRRLAIPRPLALDDGLDSGRNVRSALDPRPS